jgi:spore germination protein GerM
LTWRRVAQTAGLTVVAAGLGWLLFVGLPRWYGPRAPGAVAAAPSQPPAPPGRKIKAHLFYVADDGTQLTSVERDVTYGEGTIEQAKAIINAQIAPATEPLVSPVPAGTTLRALFVTPKGEAYVDLSRELAEAHPGGSLNELLTVYALVDALTVNLPAISTVQVLIDGKEVETLAGHVDLRRPLAKNLRWVQ